MPRLQKLRAEMKSKGLQVLTINVADKADAITRYLSRSHLDLPVALDTPGRSPRIATQYGILAYPTSYVLGPSGEVVFRCAGSDETGIRAALRRLGVL